MQAYPQIVEYNEAVQHPDTAFVDPELQQARLTENALGLPLVLSGGFALTYKLIGTKRDIAVRCFHRQIPAVEKKYAAISQTFRRLNCPYFVGFDFLEQGIRVRQQIYPLVKMDWADGEILGVWLERNRADPAALTRIRSAFAVLAQYLEEQMISHGDIQNGNVIVSPQGIKLVDYDGVHVPGMPIGEGAESGHKHFQHPDRHVRHHGPGVDRFSFIALDLSLAALVKDPSLFKRYSEGGETILFRANDFADPDRSEVFRILAGKAMLGVAAERFAAICKSPIEGVPTLQAFLADDGAPCAAPPAAPPRPRDPGYINTYPVMSAANFAAVIGHVGHRVELIGRIVTVEAGISTGGKRHGQPCLQVNFSRHWRNMVRLTIWSSVGDFSASLGQDWPGKWVSAVGLIGQPFVTDAFLVPRTHVGIALDDPSQLNFISAEQAEFRLAQTSGAARAAEDRIVPLQQPGFAVADGGGRGLHNRQLLAQMLADNRRSRGATPAPNRIVHAVLPSPPAKANGNIISPVRSSPMASTTTAARPRMQPPPSPTRRPSGRSPVMVLHPRQPGMTAASAPLPTQRPAAAPPTWLELALSKLGLFR